MDPSSVCSNFVGFFEAMLTYTAEVAVSLPGVCVMFVYLEKLAGFQLFWTHVALLDSDGIFGNRNIEKQIY